MGYMQDADRWLDALLVDFSQSKIGFNDMKRAIREKLLESYRNGLKVTPQDGTRRSREIADARRPRLSAPVPATCADPPKIMPRTTFPAELPSDRPV